MNMFKATLLMTSLLTAPVTFSAFAQSQDVVAHVSVSAISGTPSAIEGAIAKLAQENQASSWKITSMRIDNNAYATAVLYK